jgi:NhaB family Na+:H+ antiporter
VASIGTLGAALFDDFLGTAPRWYKLVILACLAVNPLVLATLGPFVAGWLLLAEFILTLALALKCYPLQPGGLLAIEAVVLGLATPQAVYDETTANFAVILLLMFMVAGIYFLRDLLLFTFTRLLLGVRSKAALALAFCAASALLSAFLDALTVIAVVIAVASGFHAVYHRAASGRGFDDDHAHWDDGLIPGPQQADLERFRAFLRSLLMHAAVGTALGGVCTLVGEPQNLLIGEVAGWTFVEFFQRVAPVSMPVLAAGLVLCVLLERLRLFGYGETLPAPVRAILEQAAARNRARRDARATVRLWVQGFAALLLVLGLGLHLAAVGLVGLAVIVIATSLTGVVDEKRLGHAFEEALPFTALLVTFFAIVAVIHQQHLFQPVIEAVLAREGR